MDIILILPTLLLLIVLALGSAFFAGSESALTSSSRAKMHALEQDGDKRAATVNKVMANKDRFIGTILLGNTALNALIATILGDMMTSSFGDAGVYVATLLATALLLIFCEVLPKTYALYHADSMARLVAWPMYIFIVVSSPITASVGWIVEKIMACFGMAIDRESKGIAVHELRGAIDLHHGHEDDIKERRHMLRSVLDLDHMTVEDVMSHRRNVSMVSIDQPVADAIAQILDLNHSRVPVWSGSPENIVGLIHVKQLLFALQDVRGDMNGVDLQPLMQKPWFIPESTTLLDQLQAFRARREHFAVVVDEYGTFMGIVTLEDILEEIVGDIEDEQDLLVPGVRRMPDGSYLVNGDFPIRDLNRELSWDLPDDEDYTTAAGLVIYESRTLPQTGQSFAFHGYQFDIVKRQRHQITVLKITPLPVLAKP
jgi:Mg2+/Co2+ transporter CorB